MFYEENEGWSWGVQELCKTILLAMAWPGGDGERERSFSFDQTHDCSPSWALEPVSFCVLLLRMEKEMATHSSILAWRIPCHEESRGLYKARAHIQDQ